MFPRRARLPRQKNTANPNGPVQPEDQRKDLAPLMGMRAIGLTCCDLHQRHTSLLLLICVCMCLFLFLNFYTSDFHHKNDDKLLFKPLCGRTGQLSQHLNRQSTAARSLVQCADEGVGRVARQQFQDKVEKRVGGAAVSVSRDFCQGVANGVVQQG